MSSTPNRSFSQPSGFTRINPPRPAAGTGSGAAGGGQKTGGTGGSPASRTGSGAGGPQRTGGGTSGAPRPGGSTGGPQRTGGGPGGHRPGGQGGGHRPGGQRSGGGRPQQRNAPQQRRPEPPKEDVKEKEEAIELEGVITAVLAGTMFRVKLKNEHEVLAHISGKMRKKFIRLVIGDGVKLEMSPYDMDKARIVYRL